MKCTHLLDAPGAHSTERLLDFWICGAPAAPGVQLPCPMGRPDAVGEPYCDAHGGAARADAEARTDWNYLAPACVGDADAVLRAGCYTLTSEHLFVVIRRRGPAEGGRWTVARGIGSHLRDVPGTWDSALLAERAAVEFWREAYGEGVAAIRAARGGTLDWGLPLPLRDAPLVVVCGASGTSGDAPRRDPLPEALALPFVPGRPTKHRRHHVRW